MAILGVGFLITLPIFMFSTPDEKQRLTQSTTTMRIVEHHVGLIDVTPEERIDLKTLIKKEDLPQSNQPERDAWVDKVSLKIIPFEKSEHEAKAIARWVWLYAQRHNLRPTMILALITIESRFDPFATSSVGAQGLMQVMPFWKKELGTNNDNLFDVETNIRYGSAILKHYIKRYKTPKRALAAYNGSLGRDKYPNKVFSQLDRFE
ncbi:MAG: lytic transglycosylase domain-containing protein [Ghiorsea sp.]